MSSSNVESFQLSSISAKFTEKTLTDILNKALNKNDCSLAKWEVAGGPGARGDSYLSEVIRMKVQAKCSPGDEDRNSVYLIIKCLPSNIGRRKTFRSTDYFRNETAFYDHVVPAFEDLQKHRNINYHLFPKCYASLCDGKEDFIALADLSLDGYKTAVRQEGMNFGQCKIIMSTMAKFHGLSYALKDQNPEKYSSIITKLEETYYDVKFSDWFKDFHRDQIICCLDALEKEYPNSEYQRKLIEFTKENFFENMIALVEDKNQYSVINHGDSWIPNFMMNFEDGAPKSVKLIDFQLARVASPILDLTFFIYSGTTQDLREKHFEELMKYYYDHLCKTITELGSDAGKLLPESFMRNELKKNAKFGLGFSFESVPFSVMDNEEAADLDTIEGEEAVPITTVWIVRPIKSKEGRLRLADNVRHAVDNGFL